MKTGSKIFWIAGFALAFLAMSGSARAQSTFEMPTPPPPHGGGDVMFFQEFGPGPVMAPDTIGFVSFEGGMGGKIVTGAPFSATILTQTSQTLADGNHIQRTSTGTLARDAQGRTRRDMTFPALGPWATSGMAAPHVSMINDPVAGVHYVLEPDQKIARKFEGSKDKNGDWQTHGHPHVAVGATLAPPPDSPEVTTTSLGTQIINGVSAEGTRITRTIAAGAIGNEKPIVITIERWYSADLQTVVMTKRSDPRTGDSIFQLTNIQLQEPDASLFQVPTDYTIKTGAGMRHQIVKPLSE